MATTTPRTCRPSTTAPHPTAPEPDLSARLQHCVTVPLHPLFDHPGGTPAAGFHRVSHAVSIAILADVSGRADASQPAEILHDQGFRAAARPPRPPARQPCPRRRPPRHKSRERAAPASCLTVAAPCQEADSIETLARRLRRQRPRAVQPARARRLVREPSLHRRPPHAQSLTDRDRRDGPKECLGLRAGDVGRGGEDIKAVHAPGPKRCQRHALGGLLGPPRGFAVDGVRRHLVEGVGRDLLLGMIRQRPGQLVSGGPIARAIRRHRQLQRVFNYLELAARCLCLIGVRSSEAGHYFPCRHRRAFADFAADDHALQSLRSAREGPEGGASQTCHAGAVRGVDDRLGENGLPARPVDHHHATRPAVGIAEYVRHIRAVQEIDTGGQQRTVEHGFDMHRPRHGRRAAACSVLSRALPDDFDSPSNIRFASGYFWTNSLT